MNSPTEEGGRKRRRVRVQRPRNQLGLQETGPGDPGASPKLRAETGSPHAERDGDRTATTGDTGALEESSFRRVAEGSHSGVEACPGRGLRTTRQSLLKAGRTAPTGTPDLIPVLRARSSDQHGGQGWEAEVERRARGREWREVEGGRSPHGFQLSCWAVGRLQGAL